MREKTLSRTDESPDSVYKLVAAVVGSIFPTNICLYGGIGLTRYPLKVEIDSSILSTDTICLKPKSRSQGKKRGRNK